MALQLFLTAAEQGLPSAMINAADILYKGAVGPRDFALSSSYIMRAAEAGEVKAIASLAVRYADGTGLPRSYSEAMRWARRGAELGSPEAANFIGALLGSTRYGGGVPDVPLAVAWIAKAAAMGSDTAVENLQSFARSGSEEAAEALRGLGILASA